MAMPLTLHSLYIGGMCVPAGRRMPRLRSQRSDTGRALRRLQGRHDSAGASSPGLHGHAKRAKIRWPFRFVRARGERPPES